MARTLQTPWRECQKRICVVLLVSSARVVEVQPSDGQPVGYGVELQSAWGGQRIESLSFVTWVGAAAWIAAQGCDLSD